jgi:hypothetical protein
MERKINRKDIVIKEGNIVIKSIERKNAWLVWIDGEKINGIAIYPSTVDCPQCKNQICEGFNKRISRSVCHGFNCNSNSVKDILKRHFCFHRDYEENFITWEKEND